MALSNEAKSRLRVAVAQPVSGDEISTAIDLSTTEVDSARNGTLKVTGSNVETSTTNAGALSVSKVLSNISSAGSESRTLAAPSSAGQIKIIQMTVDGGAVTLSLTNVVGSGGSTATFDDVGDTLVLISAASKWVYLGGSATIS